jgi:putative endonuclease
VAFWTYILRCADARYYTGHTDNLEQRIAQHQTGGFCDFTYRRRPVELVWSQEFPSRIEALEAERRIKPWSRAKKEALIRGDWAALSYFARPPKERPSTTLGTNGEAPQPQPFVSSEVETRRVPMPDPFRSSEAQGRTS